MPLELGTGEIICPFIRRPTVNHRTIEIAGRRAACSIALTLAATSPVLAQSRIVGAEFEAGGFRVAVDLHGFDARDAFRKPIKRVLDHYLQMLLHSVTTIGIRIGVKKDLHEFLMNRYRFGNVQCTAPYIATAQADGSFDDCQMDTLVSLNAAHCDLAFGEYRPRLFLSTFLVERVNI